LSIHLRVVETPAEWHRWGGKKIATGDMWRVPSKDLPDRECWAILLPNGAGVWFTTEEADGVLWEVTGAPPAITVTPSINAEPYWHGNITNGELTP